MGWRFALATLITSLVCASAARADTYFVDTAADGAGSCAATTAAGVLRCPTLRSAVAASNANPDSTTGVNFIYLQANGPYTVAGALNLTSDVYIFGRGPRTTTVQGAGTDRIFTVPDGVQAILSRMTISGGRATGIGAEGGNIVNQGVLALTAVRVTGGTASDGGGIANFGTGQLIVTSSLIDGNAATLGRGGGIWSHDGGVLSISNSTIALNTASGELANGGGLAVNGTGNTTQLIEVTIARNTASGSGATGGLYVGNANQTVGTYGSLLAANTSRNCGGAGAVQEGAADSNKEDAGTCGFHTPGTNVTVGAALSNQGGDTDVLTIPSSGGAKQGVNPCYSSEDQRGGARPSNFCDAGAFQEGVLVPQPDDGAPGEPPLQGPPTATPTPSPTAVPTATATPVPTPVFQQTVAVQPQGTVKVKKPGSKAFVLLTAGATLPLGSDIDTKDGSVTLTSIPKAGAPPETAKFYDGIFKVNVAGGVTNLTLDEPLAACPKKGHAAAAAKKPKTRQLWGSGKGAFRTTGKYSAATVRGTKWNVKDSCAGTLTTVAQGVVSVRDNVRKKTILVKAPKHYLARPTK